MPPDVTTRTSLRTTSGRAIAIPGRNDPTHGLGNQVDRSVDLSLNKTNEIFETVEVRIMWLIAETGPRE